MTEIAGAKHLSTRLWQPFQNDRNDVLLFPRDSRVVVPDLLYLNGPCHRPLIRMIIQYDGEIANCCETQPVRLNQALTRTFASLHLNYTNWVLPLSGGFDSRALLLLLNHRNDIQAITWGLKSSLMKPDSDAFVARLLVSQLNVSIQVIRTMPDSLRTNKTLFRQIVEGLGPNIAFAKFRSISHRTDILNGHTAKRLIMDELSNSCATNLLSDDFLSRIRDKLNTTIREQTRPSAAHQAVNAFIKLLAFRSYMICKINRLLASDANALKHQA